MNKNCLDIIRSRYSFLNKAQKKVAQYILDNPSLAVNENIKTIAKKTGVSESTIFRFTNSLNYKGFQEFKIDLAKSLSKPISNIYSEVDKADGPYIIMQKLISGYEYSLKETLRLNIEETIFEVVKKIKSSRKIYMLANGGSYPYAEDAVHKFVRNGIDCEAYNDIHWAFMKIGMAKPDDLVIIFSSSGANKDLIEALDYAKERRLYTITFTAKSDSILAKNSDLTLLTYGREYSARTEAFESRISTLLIIDTIYLLLTIEDENFEQITLNNLFKIRDAISKRRNRD